MEYGDAPEPKLSHNGVLIRVKAAALNPVDGVLQAGLAVDDTEAWFPVIPGWDVAGIVERVGAGVCELAPGDEVIGYVRQEILHHGAYAEWVSAPVETLVRKPRNASWAEAAGLPFAGLTAHHAVAYALDVQPDEAVLIHDAASGVGVLAAQLAIGLGAQVIGTAAEGNHEYLRLLGVTPVLPGEGLTERVRDLAPDGVDATLDCYGRGVIATAIDSTSADARTCSILDGGPSVKTIFARLDATVLLRLVAMMEQGKLRMPIAASYPLAHAAAAQAALAQPHAAGKIVLEM